MRKNSKKLKGAAILEPKHKAPTKMNDDVHPAPVKNLIECKIPEPLEPEEVGIKIFIFAPKHSKSFRKLANVQFKAGLVAESGTVILPDGQTIKAGATIKTEMTPELKMMLRDGVFLAGKAPRRS